MKHARAYIEYLRDILNYATKAQDFLVDTTFPEFVANEEKALAVLHALQIIGEAANRLPRRLTQQYPDVHWADITGMRNFIAHGYFLVDLEIVWRTVHEDLPTLQESVAHILAEINSGETEP